MNERDIEASLKKISAEIQTVTDAELNTMGQETSMMVHVLSMVAGKDHKMYLDAKKLLVILENEYDRRRGKVTEKAVPSEKAPRTIDELLALGDGSVQEIEIAEKPKVSKIKVPDTFCELMSLG